jgi:hypothetical protein
MNDPVLLLSALAPFLATSSAAAGRIVPAVALQHAARVRDFLYDLYFAIGSCAITFLSLP